MSFRVQSPAAAAELQNNTTRIYFAILKAAWQKSRRDFFVKLPPALPGALLAKHLFCRKFRREEKCERKPSGCPFAFNHPPRRQNCKIRCYNILFCNSGSSLAKKARRDFFDKLGSGQPGPAHCCRSEQAVDKTGKAKGLSLRGGRRPTWQSRAGNYDFADSFPTIWPGTARLPRAQSALAMTSR